MIRRRWPRRTLVGALAFVVVVLAAVLGALLYLRSSAGGSKLRDAAIAKANEVVRGKLEVGKVRVTPQLIILEDVKLYDPEGELVAEIARLEVVPVLSQLIERDLDLASVRVIRPRVYLKQDERGLNLTRAIEARQLAPKKGLDESGRPRFEIRVQALTLEDGAVELVTPGRRYAAEQLTAQGKATYETFGKALDVFLSLTGRETAPLAAPLSARVSATGKGEALRAELELSLGAMRLKGSADRPGPGTSRLSLEELTLPPAELEALAPGYPLREPVRVVGEVSQRGDAASVRLTARAGSASARLSAEVDLATKRASEATFKVEGLDPHQLLGEGPRTRLSLELSGRGGGTSLETLEGAATLKVGTAEVEGELLGPLRAKLSADGGKVRLSDLLAQLPGLTLTGQGWASREALSLKGKLEAVDLERAAKAVRAFGVALPPASGSGQLAFSGEGAWRHPALKVSAAFPSLRVGEVRGAKLSLRAEIPDLFRPLQSFGDASAQSLRVGDATFEQVRLALVARGRALSADVSTRGFEEVRLHAAGTLDPDGRGALVSQLELKLPLATWALAAPTRVGFDEAASEVAGLTLRSGDQSISLAGRKAGEKVDASVEVRALDLALLPRIAAPVRWGLGGLVSGTARVQGKVSNPTAEAKVAWERVSIRGLTGLSGEGRVALAQGRVEGTCRVEGPLLKARGSFDVPPAGRPATPLVAHVELDRASVAPILEALGLPAKASAEVSGRLDLTGTAEAPLAQLDLRAPQLAVTLPGRGTFAASAVVLSARSGEGGALEGQLSLEAWGGRAAATVRTPFTLAQWRKAPPDREALARSSVTGGLEVTGVDLAELSRVGLLPEPVKGRAWAKASVSGPLRTPLANLELTIAGASARGLPPGDVSLTARAVGDEVTVRVAARQKGRSLARVDAQVGASLETLLGPGALDRIPVAIQAEAGPVLISELRSAADLEARSGARLEGSVQLQLKAEGSLDDPRLSVRSQLSRLSLGTLSLGAANAAYDYHRGNSSLALDATSPGGGVLSGRGKARVDLSLGALRKGVKLDEAPLEVELKASRFDLQMFAGLSPEVRTLAGALRADARLKGTLAAPVAQGTIEVTSGKVSAFGFGEYRDVHLLLEGNNDRVVVKELAAKSGGGSVRFTGTADRRGEAYAVQVSAEATALPIVADDQLMATATTRLKAVGEFSKRIINLREVTIPEAHLVLPEVKRKDLQQLARPDDIVVLKDGRPVDRQQRKKLGAGGQKSFAVPRESELPLQVRAVLSAPQNLWLKSSDVNAELGLSEGFRVEYARGLSMKGEIRVLRGRAYVLGRKFDVKRDAAVRFSGPANLPQVDLSAVHVNEGEGVTVTVAVSGRGKDLTLRPTSEPPLSESEIYTLLATGRRTLKRGSGAAMSGAEAASIIGSLAAAQLKGALAKKLPLDVISIESADSDDVFATKIEAGTYINDQLYLGYTGQVRADAAKGQNTHEAKLEYRLNSRWSFEAKFGDAPAGAADLVWSRDY